jgi:hypothetical protein
MDRNLYSPPSSPISDINKPAGTAVRPSQVSIAVLLLAASLALGTVTTALLQPHYARNSQTVSVQILTFVLLVWLTYKIWLGRNWARITFAVFWGLGFAFYVPILLKIFQFSPVAGFINVLQSLLQIVALYFLFSDPGRRWFKGKLPVA